MGVTSGPASCVLVTGGAGFIGSCFVLARIATRAARVVDLDKLSYAGNLDNLASIASDPAHVFVRGDIGDQALVARLLDEHRPAAIVNFAAESSVDRSIDGPAAFIETNVVGTFRLLEAARAYHGSLSRTDADRFRFLQVSTDEVYGSLGATGAFTEERRHAPSSPYAASKAAADDLVHAYHHTYGLPTLTTHCSNNYGPRQFPEKLIPLMILAAIRGEPLPVYGDGQHVRDWLHVSDHCDALDVVLARGAPGETYDIGGLCERRNLDVVHAICDAVDEIVPSRAGSRRELVSFVADRPGHDRRYAIDPTKIARELGWQPARSFERGIREAVRWYLDHGDWCARIARGVYRGERLGLPEVGR
jgi:dTDP-glucose 4,6-dehydratase